MLTSRGLPRWISTNDKSVVSRGSLELGRSTRKLFSLLFSGIGKCRYAALPFRGALSFTTIFFYVRACFSTFSRCTRFFYEIVKTLKRWLAFSRHVMFADIFSFLFHASLWRIRETASKRYTVVDYSVNHWKFIHLRKQVAFPDCTFEAEKKYIIKFVGEYPYSFSDSTPP